MTFGEFIIKYMGKRVDFDGAYGVQCVDLFRQYCKDVVGCPHTGAVEGARDLWFKFSENREKNYFYRLNASQAKFGDVIIYDKTASNPYGHVALVVNISGSNCVVLEQDGFRQDGVKLSLRPFNNVLGILRKK